VVVSDTKAGNVVKNCRGRGTRDRKIERRRIRIRMRGMPDP
jgi:hypothetical protein